MDFDGSENGFRQLYTCMGFRYCIFVAFSLAVRAKGLRARQTHPHLKESATFVRTEDNSCLDWHLFFFSKTVATEIRAGGVPTNTIHCTIGSCEDSFKLKLVSLLA